jgi:FixJ family two-component response regulator
LPKPFDDEALLNAVTRALVRSTENWRNCGEVAQIRARVATLTPREFVVFRLVIAGCSTNRSLRNSAPRYGRQKRIAAA